MRHTQPDLSFSVSLFASKLTNATVAKIVTVNKIVNKIKTDQYKLKYLLLDPSVKLVLYTDVAFGNHSDGGSQGVHVIILADKGNNCNLISWMSKRIKKAVLNALAVEAMTMVDLFKKRDLYNDPQ